MSFIVGLLLVNAPASALNNAGSEVGERVDNMISVKVIRTPQGTYPYVSAQAVRYWWRTTLEREVPGWQPSPIRRERKVAYTDGDPIRYWDDDLFGYMRAPSQRGERTAAADSLSEVRAEITRTSPLRVGTLVSLAPASPVRDFGTMSRHEGDPVPHEHEFYRAILRGMFAVDLDAAGTFTYVERSGFRNLDELRVERAKEAKLEHLPDRKAYRLPRAQRVERVRALLEGLASLAGGAKQTLHLTDVAPVVVVAAVTKGANNPLTYVLGPGERGSLAVHPEAVEEVGRVWKDRLLSGVYVGWRAGFEDGARESLRVALEGLKETHGVAYVLDHPRAALARLSQDLASSEWLG